MSWTRISLVHATVASKFLEQRLISFGHGKSLIDSLTRFDDVFKWPRNPDCWRRRIAIWNRAWKMLACLHEPRRSKDQASFKIPMVNSSKNNLYREKNALNKILQYWPDENLLLSRIETIKNIRKQIIVTKVENSLLIFYRESKQARF